MSVVSDPLHVMRVALTRVFTKNVDIAYVSIRKAADLW